MTLIARFLGKEPPLQREIRSRPLVMVEREGRSILAYHRGFRMAAAGKGESLAEALTNMEAAMKSHIARIGGRLL